MKNSIALLIIVLGVLVGCQPAVTPSLAPTPVPPTSTPLPTVTATLPPTSTPTITPMPSPSGDLVINKDFKDAAEPWCEKATYPFGQFYCQDGEYHLINMGTGSIATRTTDGFKDLIIEAQMKAVGEVGSFGVAFRGQTNPTRFYIFRIRPAGQFQLIKWPESQSQNAILISWTDSAAIKKGQATNQLEVIAQGKQITLFANGEQLASISDDWRLHRELPKHLFQPLPPNSEGDIASSNHRLKMRRIGSGKL